MLRLVLCGRIVADHTPITLHTSSVCQQAERFSFRC